MSLRRNKSKFEYTLQGWKAFALAHAVNTGDRLQMELLPDGRRMRAHIVRRAALRDKLPSDPGPASPTLLNVACVAKRSLGAAMQPSVFTFSAHMCSGMLGNVQLLPHKQRSPISFHSAFIAWPDIWLLHQFHSVCCASVCHGRGHASVC